MRLEALNLLNCNRLQDYEDHFGRNISPYVFNIIKHIKDPL
jgi:hypothetical protein